MRTALALLLLVLATASPADARTVKIYSYPVDQTWPAALRFLRVDEGCKIVEKDAEAGYVLFELADGGRTYAGSLELARVKDDDGRPSTKGIVNVAQRPTYVEQGLLDRLEAKLRDELGEPPDPPAAPPPPAKGKKEPKR